MVLQSSTKDPNVPPWSARDVHLFIGGFIFCWLIFFFLQRQKTRSLSQEVAPSATPANREVSGQLELINDILRTNLNAIHHPEKFVVLLFGPAVTGGAEDSIVQAIGRKRHDVRQALEKLRFKVVYGEDIEGAENDDLLRDLHISLKEKLLGRGAHAILILASSVGSAAEVGVFSQDPEFCKKMAIAVYQEHSEGFLAKGPCAEAETHGARLFIYSYQDLKCCNVQTRLVTEALRLYKGVLSRSLASKAKI
jgi:hypothetical protein